MDIKDMNIKIFADGADADSMLKAKEEGIVKGFTTNPTLMRKAGVKSYEEFAKTVLIFRKTNFANFAQIPKETEALFAWLKRQ